MRRLYETSLENGINQAEKSRRNSKALVTDQTGENKIACPKCKSLNEPSNVTCSSCGINFIHYKMLYPHDFSRMHGTRKRRTKE